MAGADGCAEAIRQYHLATELVTGDDVWSRHIKYKAPNKALEIFRSYVNSNSTILSPNLEMSIEERAKEIEFLLDNKARISGGTIAEIRPLYWLAILYHALDDNVKAEQRMRCLVEEEGSNRLPKEWVALFLDVLEANGCHDETYRWLTESTKEKKLEVTES